MTVLNSVEQRANLIYEQRRIFDAAGGQPGAEARAQIESIGQVVDRLQSQMGQWRGYRPPDERDVDYRAWEHGLRHGPESLPDDERRALQTTSNPQGGYLVAPQKVYES